MVNKSTYLNNCFNYHGNKFKLVPQITPLLPKNINNYYELFGGGYTLGLNVEAKHHNYNDRCYQIANLIKVFKEKDIDYILDILDSNIKHYNLFKGCKLSKEEKYRLYKGVDLDEYDLKLLTNPEVKDKELKNFIIPVKDLTEGQIKFNEALQEEYDIKRGVPEFKRLRDDYNSMKEETEEKSLLLYTLMLFSFNNQYGFSGAGQYNIPKGNGRSDFNIALRQKLISFCAKIKEIDLNIMSKDFSEFNLQKFGEDDFVYIDPPYLITDDSYSRNPENQWGEDKEKELLEFLDYLDSKGVSFMLSNVVEHKGRLNTFLAEWSSKYNIRIMEKDYNNCNYQAKDDGNVTKEVVVYNYMIIDNLNDKDDDNMNISSSVMLPLEVTEVKDTTDKKVFSKEFRDEMINRSSNGESIEYLCTTYGFTKRNLAGWKSIITRAERERNEEQPEAFVSTSNNNPLTELQGEIQIKTDVIYLVEDNEGNVLESDTDLEGMKACLTYLYRSKYRDSNIKLKLYKKEKIGELGS